MAMEDKEVVTTVEGNLCVPSLGVIEAEFTPNPDPTVQLPTPNSMGTEELATVTMEMLLVSLGFIAGHVRQPTHSRTSCAPTVTVVFSEVIAMRECQSGCVYFGNSQNYWLSVANCLSPQLFFQ